VVIVLDEAYTEYLPPNQRYDALGWVAQHPNLIVSRSFSKAYGLAGLRIGFGIAQAELTDLMNRLRQPFNVNSLAQAAAIAALQDEAFLAKSAQINNQGYTQITNALTQMGLTFIPSFGNFVLFKAGEANDAGAKVNLALLKKGIIVRPVGNYGLPQWLRVSIGLPEENAAFLTALQSIIG
jgi:histidinol-phosphate aminotransferase